MMEIKELFFEVKFMKNCLSVILISGIEYLFNVLIDLQIKMPDSSNFA
jgi:hypothetical protein